MVISSGRKRGSQLSSFTPRGSNAAVDLFHKSSQKCCRILQSLGTVSLGTDFDGSSTLSTLSLSSSHDANQ